MWTACILAYQVLLVVSYGYAHLIGCLAATRGLALPSQQERHVVDERDALDRAGHAEVQASASRVHEATDGAVVLTVVTGPALADRGLSAAARLSRKGCPNASCRSRETLRRGNRWMPIPCFVPTSPLFMKPSVSPVQIRSAAALFLDRMSLWLMKCWRCTCTASIRMPCTSGVP